MGIKKLIKKKYGEYKRERTIKKVATKQIKEKARAEYYRTKQAEEISFAKQKAKLETKRKLTHLKTSRTGFGGTMKSISAGLNTMGGMIPAPRAKGKKGKGKKYKPMNIMDIDLGF